MFTTHSQNLKRGVAVVVMVAATVAVTVIVIAEVAAFDIVQRLVGSDQGSVMKYVQVVIGAEVTAW